MPTCTICGQETESTITCSCGHVYCHACIRKKLRGMTAEIIEKDKQLLDELGKM